MKENKILYSFLKVICKTILKVLYRPKVIGLENIPEEGAIIFAGNHRHAFDPVVVMTSTKRMVHYMAKSEIFKGLHGKLLEAIGIIKVNRSKSNPVAIKEAQEALSTTKGSIGIFPEGTRNKTEEDLLRFRHGAVVIAKNTNSKIVPFAINGKYTAFKKGLTLEFGKPIDVSNMEIEEANEVLRNEVLKIYRGIKI